LVIYGKEALLRNEADFLGDFKLGDELTEGAFGYVEKPYEFGI
jgi:hypothetical protein